MLFAPAFPIASLVSYLSFLLEIRTDAYKLLVVFQRPRYRGARDIGAWMQAMNALSVACVFTNVGLSGYTSTTLTRMLPLHLFGLEIVTHENKLSALLVLVVLILCLRALVNMYLPDYPVDVARDLARQTWRKRVEAQKRRTPSEAFVVLGSGWVGKPNEEWDDARAQADCSSELDALLHPSTAGKMSA